MRRERTRGRWRSKAERNLAHGLGEVRRLASALELSESIRDQACQLFRSAQNEDLLRGRSIEGIGAASIYGTRRCNQHPLVLEDVVDAARVESSRVTNAYRTLNRELELLTPPMRPTSFIPRLISELELDHDIQCRANELAARAEETALSNGCQSTNDVRVQWAADGVDAAWYAVTDSDAGSIEGGPGRVDDPDVTFTGDVGTPSGMLGDDGLEPQQAFVDGAFQMNGDVQVALQFGWTTDAVQRNAEAMTD